MAEPRYYTTYAQEWDDGPLDVYYVVDRETGEQEGWSDPNFANDSCAKLNREWEAEQKTK